MVTLIGALLQLFLVSLKKESKKDTTSELKQSEQLEQQHLLQILLKYTVYTYIQADIFIYK
jgi:hypothetical protein